MKELVEIDLFSENAPLEPSGASQPEISDLGREVIPEAAEGGFSEGLPGVDMAGNPSDRTAKNLMAGIEARKTNSIRIFQMLYPQEEFTKIEAMLAVLRKRFGFENNSKVCKKLIEEAHGK